MKKGLIVTLIFTFIFTFTLSTAVSADGNIAVVFATGGLGDKSFNDSAFEGMQRAKEELGIQFDAAEPSAIAEYEPFLRQFAAIDKYDLIISIGFDQADAVNKIAARYPDQNFALIDATVDQPNVASYVYNEKERGFLMGVAAAMMTTRTDDPLINEEKKIGVVGGMKIPLIDANIAGYYSGAHYIDPEIEVQHTYVGGWADPSKAKELTISMIEDGADIIWGAAGRSGLGVINAAKENDCYAMGADSAQDYLAPDNVLSNGMKFVNNTVYLAIEQVIEGDFETGVNLLGIEENALGYTESLLPDEVIKELEQVKEKIVAGEIEIPETIEEVQE